MKRILSIELALCLIFSIIISSLPIKAQALNQLEISTGGTTSKATYSQTDSNEEIRIFSSSTEVVRQYILPPEGSISHYRLCFELADSNVSRTIKFDVNKGTVKQIRLANSDNKGTSVVVEVTKEPHYTLAPASDGKSFVLSLKGVTGSIPTTPGTTPKPSTTPKPTTSTTPIPSSTSIPVTSTPQPGTGSSIKDPADLTKNGPLSWSMSGDTCIINLSGISLSQTNQGNIPCFELREKEKLIQITLPGKDTRFTNGYLSGNSVIYGMLVNYNEKQNKTIIRIPYSNAITYTHTNSNGSSVIKVKKLNTTVPGTTTKPSPTPAPSVKPTPVQVTSKPSPTPSPISGSNGIVFNSASVSVSDSDFSGANVYRAGSPSRVVIEYTGTADVVNKIMPSGSLYTRAVVSQATTNRVKIELYTSGMPEWSLSQSTGKFNLNLIKTEITNIEAGSKDQKIAVRLVSAGIVGRYRKYADNIILDDDDEMGTFTFMIPASIVQLGDGTAKIENTLAKSIVLLGTKQSSFLMIHKADPNTQFKIVEGSSLDELLVTVATSETDTGSKNKLVVLDAGHGGTDPGGTVGTYYEKTYNLDIALKCEAILKFRGINVALTRRTDIFVGLDDRAKFANDRDATLFLSIHNNIMPTSYKGSMALYYPSSYDGKAYAKIIQDNMVRDLKTGDIGLKANGNLVVVKKTTMPAVLAEVACMSYPADLELLNAEAFRQKAAESLANSVMEILNLK